MTGHRDDLTSVREQLFVLAHDETRSLRPHIHGPAIGVGLAGAALIDLMIAKRIHIAQGSPYLHRSYEQGPAGDPVTRQVLAMIGNLRHTPGLNLLLRELGPDLYEQTLAALVAKDIITRERRWGRRRYELARITPAARVRQNVRYRIEGRQRPEPAIDALCALTWALNLQHCLVMDLSDADISELLRGVMHRIPELVRWSDPDSPAAAIPEVADAVRTAVAAMATSPTNPVPVRKGPGDARPRRRRARHRQPPDRRRRRPRRRHHPRTGGHRTGRHVTAEPRPRTPASPADGADTHRAGGHPHPSTP